MEGQGPPDHQHYINIIANCCCTVYTRVLLHSKNAKKLKLNKQWALFYHFYHW